MEDGEVGFQEMVQLPFEVLVLIIQNIDLKISQSDWKKAK